MRELSDKIKAKALELGFDLVGIAPAALHPESGYFLEWLGRGFAGEMRYLEREPARRMDASSLFPGAKSVISCAFNYNTPYPHSVESGGEGRGWVSRYAWGDDYHDLMMGKLKELCTFIRESISPAVLCKPYVDTGPVLERVYARYAGIGWFGKNTCIINERIGSWIYLGEVVTSLDLSFDSPPPDRCGTCTRCIDACPTGALVEPYVLDARLCISYLTIEHRGSIPRTLRGKMGNHVFGCDICQDVCPWNRKAEVKEDDPLKPREGFLSPYLEAMLSMARDDFSGVFKKSAVRRAKRGGLLRNIVVAMGNSGKPEYESALLSMLEDEDPLVRSHAAWALWRVGGERVRGVLESHLEKEKDDTVAGEIRDILGLGG
jgi:epoxyqueuosine reductase